MYKQRGDRMKEITDLKSEQCQLNSCLFFSASKMSRAFKAKAEDIFTQTGMSPSHAFILYIVNLRERVHQKEVGDYLHLTPSTITRFVDKLIQKRLIVKEVNGKNVFLVITEEGKQLQPIILNAVKDLNNVINDMLTEEERKTYIELSNKILNALSN